MAEVTLIGIDLAKQVFHLCGFGEDGTVVFRKKLSRGQLERFLGSHRTCIVAMEACASAHHWGRFIAALGHNVRLIPPNYVKPFVKRHKNDTADAEAIAEAASRPTMRLVSVKSKEQQAQAMVYRTRDMAVRQRTQLINALRAHLSEFGVTVPKGILHVKRLATEVDTPDNALPDLVRDLGHSMLAQIAELTERITSLEQVLRKATAAGEKTACIRTIPGVGPITAAAIEAFAPALEGFRRGRDFAAWLGLVPRQHSTGGKERLGRVSKMGQRDIRRLLVSGAMSVIRWAKRKPERTEPWVLGLLARKPLLVAAIALANKMARQIWAVATKLENYRNPAVTT